MPVAAIEAPIAAAIEAPKEDEFSNVFAELTTLKPDPAAVVQPDPAAVVQPDPAAVVQPDPAAVVQPDPAAVVQPDPAIVSAVLESVQGVVPPADDTMLRRLAALVKEPVPAPTPAQRAVPPVELFTPEEKVILAAYDKDWPDVSKAEAIRIRASQLEVVEHMNQQFAQVLDPLIARIGELSTRNQMQDLTAAVPDYNDETRDKVIEWAGKEPLPYLRAAYDHVIKQGSAAEVADLIQRYRHATGTPGVASASVAKPNVLPAATKKAVAALAPVKSIRSVPSSSGVDSSDFDAAFAVAAREVAR